MSLVTPHHHTGVTATGRDEERVIVREADIRDMSRVTHILLTLGMLALEKGERERWGEMRDKRNEDGIVVPLFIAHW